MHTKDSPKQYIQVQPVYEIYKEKTGLQPKASIYSYNDLKNRIKLYYMEGFTPLNVLVFLSPQIVHMVHRGVALQINPLLFLPNNPPPKKKKKRFIGIIL
jgi:hypothetical protein